MIRRVMLWALIREDWVAHGRDWTRPGFRALVLCRVGKLQRDSPSRFVRRAVRLGYRVAFRYVRNHYGIELPWAAVVGRRVVFEHQSGIVIHGDAVIGDDCILRQGVTIGNRYLDRPLQAPRLGARVNVGAGAQILGRVTIGDDARIGANAVVLSDVPARATAVGVPAIVVAPHDGAPERPRDPRRDPAGL